MNTRIAFVGSIDEQFAAQELIRQKLRRGIDPYSLAKLASVCDVFFAPRSHATAFLSWLRDDFKASGMALPMAVLV